MNCSSGGALKENLSGCIQDLGIDSKMVSNPAYKIAVSQVAGLMNNREINDDVAVREEDGVISVQWSSPSVRRYSLNISSSDSDSFQAVLVTQYYPYKDRGCIVHSKDVVELTATALDDGTMTITAREAVLTDNRSWWWFGKYYNKERLSRYYYDKNGDKINFDYQEFPVRVVDGFVESSTVEEALASVREEKGTVKQIK